MKYMIYIKEAEKIGDFLRMINAISALLYFEDIRIYRDHKNMTNRLNNCEQANMEKSMKTCLEQLENIANEMAGIEKTNAMRILDQKKLKYNIYTYIDNSHH